MIEIIRQVEAAVRVIADPLFSTSKIYRPQLTNNTFEIKVQLDDDPLNMTRVLLVGIAGQHKEIQIPNIMVPREMQRNGYGKAMIAAIREVAIRNGYSLFITDLTPSFHRRLVARRAAPINHEIVEITSDTDLTHHQ
jgi:GNAT superfamily N-acetyltransferase